MITREKVLVVGFLTTVYTLGTLSVYALARTLTDSHTFAQILSSLVLFYLVVTTRVSYKDGLDIRIGLPKDKETPK